MMSIIGYVVYWKGKRYDWVGTYASVENEYRGQVGPWKEAERGRILRINCTYYCHCLCDC